MRLRIAATFFVMFGIWVIQTDSYPIPQDVRPNWYLYGWPICFATSARARFKFSSFDTTAMIIDLVLSIVMIYCTWLMFRHLERKHPTFSIIDALAAISGYALVLLLLSDGYSTLLNTFSIHRPAEQISEMAGNSRPWKRVSLIVMPSLCLGAFSIGFMFALGTMMVFNRNTQSKPEQIAR